MLERIKVPRSKASAYEGGQLAYYQGLEADCPYPKTKPNIGRRVAWYDGYYDAQVNESIGHILEKY